MSNNDNLLNRQTWKRILCVAPHIPSHPALCGITGRLLAVRVLFVNVLPCISGLFASFAHLLVQIITTAPPMSPLLVAVHKPSMWTERFVQQNIRWTKTSCWSQRTQRQRASQAKPSETTSDLCSLARQARRTTEHDSLSSAWFWPCSTAVPGPRPGLVAEPTGSGHQDGPPRAQPSARNFPVGGFSCRGPAV